MKLRLAILFLAVAVVSSKAQSPAPIIVQAVVPGQTAAAPAVTAPDATAADTSAAMLKVLREMKAQNEDVLSKQAAALQLLDDLAKAADQLRIYNKRS